MGGEEVEKRFGKSPYMGGNIFGPDFFPEVAPAYMFLNCHIEEKPQCEDLYKRNTKRGEKARYREEVYTSMKRQKRYKAVLLPQRKGTEGNIGEPIVPL